MSSQHRSKRKSKIEPITLDELKSAAGMSGFVSFLENIPPKNESSALESSAPDSAQEHLPSPQAPDSKSHYDRSSPESSALTSSAVDPSALDTSAPLLRAPETTAPDTSAVESSAPDSAPSLSKSRRPKIREAATIQDGHSYAEQTVYEIMWRAGRPLNDDARTLTIGLRTLAELTRLAYSNCKANVRSLIEKLAIEQEEGFSYTDGRTYTIHSARKILRRRKEAGLTHVIKTRGVAFVDSSAPVSSAPDS